MQIQNFYGGLILVSCLSACDRAMDDSPVEKISKPNGRITHYEGVLGGHPAKIPIKGTRFFEYDSSKSEKIIRSFMLTTTRAALMGGKEEVQSEKTKIDIIVHSGSYYKYHPEFMEDMAKRCLKGYDLAPGFGSNYAHGTEEFWGLSWCAKKTYPSLQHKTENYYYHFDEFGKIDNYIVCGNAPYENVRCRHSFLMNPKMDVSVKILYNRDDMLRDWALIREKTSQIILDLKSN